MSDSFRSGGNRAVLPPAVALSNLLTLQTSVALIAALYFAHEVLIPITLAILLSFVLVPLVDFFRRLRLGRVTSPLVAVVFALILLTGFGGIIGSQLAQLATKIPEYATTLDAKIQTVRAHTVDRLNDLVARVGHHEAISGSASEARASGAKVGSSNASATAETPLSPLELATKYLTPALSPLATAGIVFVVTIFVLLQREDLRDRFIRLFGTGDLHRITIALDDAAQRLSRYFLAQLAVNAGFGLAIGVGLYLIGIPNPALWGMLSGLLRFVPYIGIYISAVFPIALAAAVEPGWSTAIWTIALYIGIDLMVSQAVEPMLYGHGTGLSPLAVIVAAVFWSWLWGPIGLLLSTPLTLCLVVLGRHVERLEFLDTLLGNRPALTPVESFYQRTLAGDVDEVQENAETFLKDHPLPSYYDEVVIPALRLAAIDTERGSLAVEQLQAVKNTVSELLAELATREVDARVAGEAEAYAPSEAEQTKSPDQESKAPAAAEESACSLPTKTPILCVAGKDPLDELASRMLAHLLHRRGLGVRIVTFEAASRGGIASLDLSEIALVCITYVEIFGTPSHLRYLIRRLRGKLPTAPFLVGFWAPEAGGAREAEGRTLIEADYYSTSLQETVDCCVRAAEHAAQTGERRWQLAA
jgi:predicted PurR-regulated permease PerM